MANDRFCWATRPHARHENVVAGARFRFTVLTERLIRCEFSAAGQWEDRASQTVFYRDFSPVAFTCEQTDGTLCIDTAYLSLRYTVDEPFSAASLCIRLKTAPAAVWHYGERVENLGGTARTLDSVNGAVPLGDGVCSRYGYALLDDSRTMLLNDEGWVEPRPTDACDLYFFGYGYAYRDAVKDYYRLTGIPPLLPDYALGNWWSRYHRYTQQEYVALMERFREEDVPFSVSVVDMDWHVTAIPEEQKDAEQNEHIHSGWTGYTWNEELFPDYKAFLQYLQSRHLKTALNLHPAAGVCPHERQYEQMAAACGRVPDGRHRVPFDILSPQFMAAYFDILHHPYEADGVDFWWMDWQQGTDYWWIHEANRDGKLHDPRETLDPLWMLNHLHILDIARNGKRPMFFSRFGGPGSQRYPVGFSGDSFVTWDSLDFQPYFTATASNIGYAWWSHDIGGHTSGYRDEELEVRWVQLGVFSPINRLHSTDDDFVRKEPWCYGDENERIVKQWLRLRHRLFPYLYTMNYRTHHDLEPLVQPMYYAYPQCDAAYRAKNQFMFGSELMVAPITRPGSAVSKCGRADAFMPQGDWFDFFTGLHYHSDRHRELPVFRTLDAYPVFAKAGAIVPMKQLQPQDNHLTGSEALEVVVFPGADNAFTLYEDAGDGGAFENGARVTTAMTLRYGATAVFEIGAAQGDRSLIPQTRSWRVLLRGFSETAAAQVWVDGKPVPCPTAYEAATRTLEVTVTAAVDCPVRVEVTGDTLMTDNGSGDERCFAVLQRAQVATRRKDHLYHCITNHTSIRWTMVRMDVESPEEQSLVDAIKEQLTLTDDEFAHLRTP